MEPAWAPHSSEELRDAVMECSSTSSISGSDFFDFDDWENDVTTIPTTTGTSMTASFPTSLCTLMLILALILILAVYPFLPLLLRRSLTRITVAIFATPTLTPVV